ncbi:hypothetical protein D3869_14705 (plasmid) [Azospirillum brasilense]|uniref:Uncharacterized protein n=1 Tax=Azospirillum brasilense TaxID=192 RepID=A0A4D8R560_AZOBR|nr:hypothetical protein D3869_14705 [Azospirillum brasilense]
MTALPHFLGSDALFRHGKGARYLNVSSRFREMLRSAQKPAHRQRFVLGRCPRKPPDQAANSLI